jgi:UDP-glucose 4-epimerase
MAEVLVTGGAGYIGSAVTELLVERGHRAVVLDNLSQGHRAAVASGAEFFATDIQDREALARAFAGHRFDAVMHFAALIAVGESVEQPLRYYRQNVGGLMNVVDAMRVAGVGAMVFSSTAAVYGAPKEVPISENCPVAPISPYGWTKLMCEQILADTAAIPGAVPPFGWISLRYFNVAGATQHCGEAHHPETHLIPRILDVAAGLHPHAELYGTDYSTPDGTCVRDYIHILDLAEAHILAVEALLGGAALPQRVFNLGNNRGYSVREVIAGVERVTGKKVPVVNHPRRDGDPPALVASQQAARRVLGWTPRLGLDEILSSAWAWRQRHPRGYAE